MPKKQSLSEHLREGRVKRGLSVVELAEAVGVSPASIYIWQRGDHQPRSGNLDALCRVLRLPIRATRGLP